MLNSDLENIKKIIPAVPGILGKDDYINAAVLVLLLSINNEYHLLLQQRSAFISQANEICFPGGKFDSSLDNSMQDTALRETEEELGLNAKNISIIGQLDTLCLSIGKTIDIFIGTADYTLADVQIDSNEVDHAFTLPLSYFKNNPPEKYSVMVKNHPFINSPHKTITFLPAKKIGLPPRYHNAWGTFKQPIFVYKTPEGIIWGLTARIINHIISQLP